MSFGLKNTQNPKYLGLNLDNYPYKVRSTTMTDTYAIHSTNFLDIVGLPPDFDNYQKDIFYLDIYFCGRYWSTGPKSTY